MNSTILKYILCIACIALINVKCEKDTLNYKGYWQIDTNFLISRITRNNKSIQEFVYNDQKKLIRIDYISNDSVEASETLIYNNMGRLSGRIFTYGYSETYEYDESGRYVRRKRYDEDGEASAIIEFSYGPLGIEKGVESYPGSDYVSTYFYSYDSKGNVIRVTKEPLFYFEFDYDDMKNPRFNWGLPSDIVQYNNPVRFFESNPISCSMPPNYRYDYEYNEYRYPVTEYRRIFNTEFIDTVKYEYLQ